jgi:UDP-N-acetylglucosamine 3-dehydrogenase
MGPIKVGVIGCGVWGRNHARVYKELKNVTLAGVADSIHSTAREIGERYKTSWYTDPTKIIEDPEIQIISICTPTITHAEISHLAIEAGKNILVEKPMANNVHEAIALIKAAKKHNVLLTVGFVERFNPAVQEAYKRISEGAIGDVILAHTRRVSRSPQRIGDIGVVKDLAIHDIDIINHLFDEDPETIFAVMGKIRHNYEDYANINISYSRNRNAFIETNWLTPRRIRTLTVTGTEGILNVEYTSQQITLENNEMIMQPFLLYKEPLQEELKSFVECVKADKTPMVTGHDGLRALQICEAALKSSDTKKMIKIDKLY